MNKQAYEHIVGLTLSGLSKKASVWDGIKQHFRDNAKHYAIGSAVAIPSMIIGGAMGGKAGAGMGALAGITAGIGSKAYDLYEDNKKLHTENRNRHEAYDKLSDAYSAVSKSHYDAMNRITADTQKINMYNNYIDILKGKQADIEDMLGDEPMLVKAINSLIDIRATYQ